MRKFFLPVRFTYSTRVTRMPALPEMKRPGSSRIFRPSGWSNGTRRAAYFCGVKIFFAAEDFHQCAVAAGERGVVNNAQSAADAEKFQAVFAFSLATSGSTLRTACSNGVTSVICEPMCIWKPRSRRFFNLAARA